MSCLVCSIAPFNSQAAGQVIAQRSTSKQQSLKSAGKWTSSEAVHWMGFSALHIRFPPLSHRSGCAEVRRACRSMRCGRYDRFRHHSHATRLRRADLSCISCSNDVCDVRDGISEGVRMQPRHSSTGNARDGHSSRQNASEDSRREERKISEIGGRQSAQLGGKCKQSLSSRSSSVDVLATSFDGLRPARSGHIQIYTSPM